MEFCAIKPLPTSLVSSCVHLTVMSLLHYTLRLVHSLSENLPPIISLIHEGSAQTAPLPFLFSLSGLFPHPQEPCHSPLCVCGALYRQFYFLPIVLHYVVHLWRSCFCVGDYVLLVSIFSLWEKLKYKSSLQPLAFQSVVLLELPHGLTCVRCSTSAAVLL